MGLLLFITVGVFIIPFVPLLIGKGMTDYIIENYKKTDFIFLSVMCIFLWPVPVIVALIYRLTSLYMEKYVNILNAFSKDDK